MTGSLAQQIRQETGFPCHIASQNLQPEEGHIYLAPGDHHMVINPPPVSLGLNQRPKLNFMRPSADALFESAGKVFGEFCVAVILSGMGRDGARGAGTIKAGGGAVFVESPGKNFSAFHAANGFRLQGGECLPAPWHDWGSNKPSSDPIEQKKFCTVRGKNRAVYSFLTIHPSIRNIPATIKRKGVARGMPSEVWGVAVWEWGS